jgi:hypothetical protein
MLDAFTLGARHGFDADHLAAISELTASERGGVAGFVAGSTYAVGHAVTIGALGLAAGAAGVQTPDWVIGATLVGLGLWAAYRLGPGHSHTHTHEHVVDGVRVRHRHRHRHAAGIGLVHGLAGAPSAVIAGGRGGLALVAFTVGLLVANGLVGAFGGVTTKLAPIAWAGIAGGTLYGAALLVLA